MNQSNRAKLASAEPRLYTSPHPGGGAAEGQKMRERLDAIDWKILAELQRDGRITNVELSRQLTGLGADVTLRIYQGRPHVVSLEELDQARAFIEGLKR